MSDVIEVRDDCVHIQNIWEGVYVGGERYTDVYFFISPVAYALSGIIGLTSLLANTKLKQ